MPPPVYTTFHIRYEPVCDQCGHGRTLHADAGSVTCVACDERPDRTDCLAFSTFDRAPALAGGVWARARSSSFAAHTGRS